MPTRSPYATDLSDDEWEILRIGDTLDRRYSVRSFPRPRQAVGHGLTNHASS